MHMASKRPAPRWSSEPPRPEENDELTVVIRLYRGRKILATVMTPDRQRNEWFWFSGQINTIMRPVASLDDAKAQVKAFLKKSGKI